MTHDKQLRILLADDDEDDAYLFQEALDQIPAQIQLIVAENGMRLMEILKSGNFKPDLIFLDMNMPIKNGLECLAEIKQLEAFKDIKVIILSTSIAQHLLDSAYAGGAHLYIQKPTSFAALIDILRRCLATESANEPLLGMEQFLIPN
ncbi:response regulator [Dyadobacter sp. CY326]|uniref:response regulator n=1 Tax=Dyadobacter sp. CY326 TaxID=2907300 RepID=UPI001F445D43|nr:response regulator [Dyadobacter sp. CY326]MCE7066256.1 response regulator [Dyadobacter sp. CY326]